MIEDYNAWKQKQQDEEEGWNSAAADTADTATTLVAKSASVAQSSVIQHPQNGLVERLAQLETLVQVLQDRNEELNRELNRMQSQLQVGFFFDLNNRVSALEFLVFSFL